MDSGFPTLDLPWCPPLRVNYNDLRLPSFFSAVKFGVFCKTTFLFVGLRVLLEFFFAAAAVSVRPDFRLPGKTLLF